MPNNYEQLAKKLIQRAKRKGARQAEAYLEIGRQSSCRVRDGEIQDLTQATARGAGLRVILKDRLGFAYTSDLSSASLDGFVDRALQLAAAAAPNKLNGLPGQSDLAAPPDVGPLFDPKVAELPSDWKIHTALELERSAKAVDPRIVALESAGAGEQVSEVIVASTEGFVGSYSGTHVFIYAAPVASDGTQLQTADWVDEKRFLDELESAEAVGREAAIRAVRMLGARKVKSQKVPVVFDPSMAASFVSSVAAAANGDAAHKKATYLRGRLGKQLGSKELSLIDDGLLRRGVATSPFDGEGVPRQRTAVIEKGLLRSFLYDSFTARKAKAHSTGNAARSYNALPMIGATNLYLEPGKRSPEEIIRAVKRGFYVTAMLGVGADLVTGQYSRGANGLWIENGELTHPVQEVTVAGNMLQMLLDVDAVGNDLRFRGSVGAPTIRFRELTIAGE